MESPVISSTVKHMMCRIKPILALGALLIATSGCVTHSPISESAMFHAATTQPSHQQTIGLGLTGAYAPAQGAARVIDAQDQDAIVNPHRFGGGVYIAGFDSDGRYGVSATLGVLMAGVDATVRLRHRNYLTAALSVPGQGHIFLQHRTFNSPRLGAAIGVGYQRDAVALEGPRAIPEAASN